MGNKLYEETHIQNIANAIRGKTGKSATMKVSQMASEISGITTETEPVLQEKNITQNGTVTPDEGYDGLSKVTVNVEGVPSEMHEVNFYKDTEQLGVFYVPNNTGIQALTNENGVVGKFALTQGSDTQVNFPYIVKSDVDFYKIYTNITLPAPYKAYALYARYSSGDWYVLALTDAEGFRLLGTNSQLYGIYGATKTIFKEFNSMEEAVAELINISNTGTISGFDTTTGYAYMNESACKNRPYYCSHYVCDWSVSTYLVLKTNPYEG